MIEALLTYLGCLNRSEFRIRSYVDDIELIIRVASRDASADVRKTSKKVFEVYKTLSPSRIDEYVLISAST